MYGSMRDISQKSVKEMSSVFSSCMGVVEQAEIKSPYKGVMANVLASSCLFTHPKDTEQHYDSFGLMFLVT